MTKEEKIAEIASNLGNKEYESAEKMKEIQCALLYAQVEDKFYDYLTSLKTILLNKVSGILTGDYETWEKTYQVCLKLYARKDSAREEGGI